jgi:colanic acid/amylovoran biosynthesis glycosyltransferase
LQLLLFRKSSDVEFADRLIGVELRRLVLDSALYRFDANNSLANLFWAFFTLLRHPLATFRIFGRCRSNGYSIKKSLGQLLSNYQLIGKRFSVVYINALQAARHFCLPALFADSTIIVSSRGQDFDWDPQGYDHVLREVDHLHVLGDYLREKAVARGFPEGKITKIPPAVSLFQNVVTEKANEVSPAFTVATAARLLWLKGYEYSIRAIAVLRQRLGKQIRLRYIVIGDGPEMEFLKVECQRLALQDCVTFTGWLSEQEVVQHLIASDVYLLLSISEAFNNSVILAQSLGLPCVVSNAGGLPENVLAGRSGFVVPRYDVHAAASALESLARSPELRRQMGEWARDRALSEFQIERQIDRYESMLMGSSNLVASAEPIGNEDRLSM